MDESFTRISIGYQCKNQFLVTLAKELTLGGVSEGKIAWVPDLAAMFSRFRLLSVSTVACCSRNCGDNLAMSRFE